MILHTKKEEFERRLTEALCGLNGQDARLVQRQKEALQAGSRKQRSTPLPGEAEVCSYLSERFKKALAVAIVSYHTDPLAAIRERVLEEEGIEIDLYDQGGQSTYQERLAYELAERYGVDVLTFTLGRSYLTKERYCNIHPRAPVIPIPYSGPRPEAAKGPFVENDTGLVKKENIYFVLHDLVQAILGHLLKNRIAVDIFSSHYATGIAATCRLRGLYQESAGARSLCSATTHSLGWDKFVNTYYEYSPLELAKLNFDHRLVEEKEGLQKADPVITVSPTEKEEVTRPSLYGVSSEKVVSIPDGVDTAMFRPYDPGRDGERVESPAEKASHC